MRFFDFLSLLSPWSGSIDRFKSLCAPGTQFGARRCARRLRPQRQADSGRRKAACVQRPGLFRWLYAKPVDQVIVGDGERVWIHDRDLNQVTVRKLSRALGSTPAALLAGSADVEKAFDLSEAGSKDGIEWLEAKPREAEAGFARVRMGLRCQRTARDGALRPLRPDTLYASSTCCVTRRSILRSSAFSLPKAAEVLGEK